MPGDVELALMAFREARGGTLSGMTRYSDHLDDMPAIGYAMADLAHDRIDKYLLLLHGHAANYQSRGAFFSTEQMSLYGEGLFRDTSVGEISADFCVPSQMLVATMTAMQLVSTQWDADEVFLARAAPRRWYGPIDGGFGVSGATTPYGTIAFSVQGRSQGHSTAQVAVEAQFSPYPGSPPTATPPTITVRVRDLDGTKSLIAVKQVPGNCTGVENIAVDPEKETVAISPSSWTVTCEFVVRFA